MTPKQAIFYGEYIKDENATRAARVMGASEASAHVIGARMLRNVKVAAAIEAWTQRKVVKFEGEAEEVLQELRNILKRDVKNLYNADGTRIPAHLLDDVTRASVAEVEDETTEAITGEVRTVRRNQRVKMIDKIRAAELLGKHFKLWTDKSEFSGPAGGPIPVHQAVTVTFVDP